MDYFNRDGVAVITIDNPPVNALSPGIPEALAEALSRAAADERIQAIVVIGAGRTFVAGVDISVLQDMAWGKGPGVPLLHDLFRQIEDSAKPVVMAIHGTALGGGLELAMAGHYRVALATAQVGQPEVNLGLIPGAEGTQRLPRLVGVERAIEMIVTGLPMNAAEARAAGLLDEVYEEDLLARAVEFARDAPTGHKTRERQGRLGVSEEVFAAGKKLALQRRPHETAPMRGIEMIELAARLPFDEGCQRELQAFRECVVTDQAKAMIHIFFAERASSKIPGTSLPVSKIAIAGREAETGDVTGAFIDARVPILSSGREAADMVVETGTDDMASKKITLRELDGSVRPGCILAAATSGLDIDELGAATSRPESVIGWHLVQPANGGRLLEIIRGRATSNEVVAGVVAVGKRLRKVCVVVGNAPGSVGERIFRLYRLEAQSLVEEGATREQVDRAILDFGMARGVFAADGWKDEARGARDAQKIIERTMYMIVNEGARVLEEGLAARASDLDVIFVNGYGFPAWRGGPMMFATLAGLNKVVSAIGRFHEQLGPRWTPSPLLEKLAAEGRTFRDQDRDNTR